MKMLFRQRFFSWLDSYDIFDEYGNVIYTVSGKLSLSHRFVISDANGEEIAEVRQKIVTFLPKFEFSIGGDSYGYLKRKFTWPNPLYEMECTGWMAEGNFLEWNYSIVDSAGSPIASIDKELLHMTDHYAIDVYDPQNALLCLMFVLSIDAEKCSR